VRARFYGGGRHRPGEGHGRGVAANGRGRPPRRPERSGDDSAGSAL